MSNINNVDLAQKLLREHYMESPWRGFAKVVYKINRWDDIMARKTYRIELKIDFNDDARHEVLTDIAKQYARDLLGSAMLLQDGRKPIVALITDDSFTGTDEIELLDEGTVHEPATA